LRVVFRHFDTLKGLNTSLVCFFELLDNRVCVTVLPNRVDLFPECLRDPVFPQSRTGRIISVLAIRNSAAIHSYSSCILVCVIALN
uniref:Uncharacterized protein n=1 Tax=Ciona savignyi TaxID=51511 RepID=H2ZCN5_CIOSA